MTDWLLITISSAVSLAVDLAVDCSLLMKHGKKDFTAGKPNEYAF